MSSMLESIVAATQMRVDELPSLPVLEHAAAEQPPPRDFTAALAIPGLSVIAEIKRRSPSAGDIDASLEPVSLALKYEVGGASAISVLTEPDFFGGSLDDLVAVRAATSLPVLRKDFTIDVRQVFEARANGADAILLITAILSDAQLGELLVAAGNAGCAAIVEVHDRADLERALEAGASVVGVNNRDLSTFRTDLGIAEELADALRFAGHVVRIAESGVSDPVDAKRMRRAGYDAILVGEALVRTLDPADLIARLRFADG